MFNAMKKLTLAATVSALALTTASFAMDTPDVSKIDVDASYDAAQDTNARELFPEISSDVKLAIESLVPVSNNAADPQIRVDIRKVALDGDTIIPDSAEFNELEGLVSIETEKGVGGQAFNVSISASTGGKPLPAGYVAVAPSNDDFYDAMVMSFAEQVVARLETLNTAGGPVSR